MRRSRKFCPGMVCVCVCVLVCVGVCVHIQYSDDVFFYFLISQRGEVVRTNIPKRSGTQ